MEIDIAPPPSALNRTHDLDALSGGTSRTRVIAWHGASGYLPDHTLEATAYAHALGADDISLAVVPSRDGHLLASSNIFLDDVTDVAARYPRRARADGRYYALDFDLREIQVLRVHQQCHPRTGVVLHPGRFPAAVGDFALTTVDKHLELILGLNRSTGRPMDVRFELVQPTWHAAQGRTFLPDLLEIVTRSGFNHPLSPPWIACAEAQALPHLQRGTPHPMRLCFLHDDDPTSPSAAGDGAGTPRLEELVRLTSGVAIPWTQVAHRPDDFPGCTGIDWGSLQQASGLQLYAIMHDVPRIPATARHDVGSVTRNGSPIKCAGLYTDFPDRARAWLAATSRTRAITRSPALKAAKIAVACG